jgi:succinate dehydrogenase/fumarate reductase cytochrome b subunit
MNTRNIHRITGLGLALFIILHMGTHLAGLWGIDAYNAAQSFTRQIYRNPLVEPALLIAFAAQIVLGIALISRNFRRKLSMKWPRVQVISGLLFLLFISQHLTAMSLARWVDGLDTNFYWPASVMNGPPFHWYFGPYYFVGVTAMGVHLGCALRLWFLKQNAPTVAAYSFWFCTLGSSLIAILIVLMLLGTFFDITLPAEWVAYLNKFTVSFGR